MSWKMLTIRDRSSSGPADSNQPSVQGTGAEPSKPDDGTLDIDHRLADQTAAVMSREPTQLGNAH